MPSPAEPRARVRHCSLGFFVEVEHRGWFRTRWVPLGRVFGFDLRSHVTTYYPKRKGAERAAREWVEREIRWQQRKDAVTVLTIPTPVYDTPPHPWPRG